jgi:hypothetical protein
MLGAVFLVSILTTELMPPCGDACDLASCSAESRELPVPINVSWWSAARKSHR